MKLHEFAIVLTVLLTTTSIAATTAVGPAAGDAGEASNQAMVTLTVTVTDNFNNGISNAELTASWDGGSNTASTASNGKAFVDVEEGARVEIDVSHGAYTRNNPVVIEDAQEQEVSITVSRKADARVTVVDEGTPVSDARVSMYKSGQGRAAARGRTGGDGVFDSDTIEQGTYRVVAVKEGYYANETTVEVTGSAETTVAIEEGIVNVEFSVRDDHFDDPRPVDGATVALEGATSASLSSSGSGTASIGLPVNARYTITVSKDGYTTVERTVQVAEAPKDVSFTLNREPRLTVEATNSRVVVGENVQLTVTDEYGEQVEGATILVDGESVGTTGADGVYRAAIDSSGEHAITAERDGVTSEEITVEGVSSGGGDSTPEATATPAGTATEVALPDFSQPDVAVKIGVAAVGVLLAFLVVRRLL